MDVPVGRVVYTSLLHDAGGIKADLTVMRLGEQHFRVVTGGFDGMRDKKWFSDHLPADGSAQLADLTSAWTTLGLWGPQARKLLQSVTAQDLSNRAFPFATCQWLEIDSLPILASRISYVGELGWELYAPFEQGARLWEILWEAGQPLGVVPVGIGVYGTTARLEKCYRAYGNELELEYNLVEAGLARPQVKPQAFIGKEAYLQQRATPPAAILCTLTVDDNTARSGFKRYMLGREPILTPGGQPITDAHGRRSYVTSAGAGPSLGKTILLSYLPPAYAKVGQALRVEYFDEHYPVTVAVVGNTPLFDPQNRRMKE
jgi:glycine cleavage system aminomethyltransferase T